MPRTFMLGPYCGTRPATSTRRCRRTACRIPAGSFVRGPYGHLAGSLLDPCGISYGRILSNSFPGQHPLRTLSDTKILSPLYYFATFPDSFPDSFPEIFFPTLSRSSPRDPPAPRKRSCKDSAGLRAPCWILAGALTGEFFPTLSRGNIPHGPCLTPKFFPLSAISPLSRLFPRFFPRDIFQLFPRARPETRQHPARDPARIPQDYRPARLPPGPCNALLSSQGSRAAPLPTGLHGLSRMVPGQAQGNWKHKASGTWAPLGLTPYSAVSPPCMQWC